MSEEGGWGVQSHFLVEIFSAQQGFDNNANTIKHDFVVFTANSLISRGFIRLSRICRHTHIFFKMDIYHFLECPIRTYL